MTLAGSLGRSSSHNNKKTHKTSPFPPTPYLHSGNTNQPSLYRPLALDRQERGRKVLNASLDHQVIDISADYITSLPSGSMQSQTSLPRPVASRNSSFTSITSPPSPTYPASILSEDSITPSHPYARGSIRSTKMKGRVATTGTRAPGIVEETEEQDELRGLRSESKLGLGGLGSNLSSASVGSRNKTDEMLGLDANAKLASLYLVSGLGKVSLVDHCERLSF